MNSSEHILRIIATMQNDIKTDVGKVRDDIRSVGEEVKKTNASMTSALDGWISRWMAYQAVVKAVRFAWSATEEKAKWDQIGASIEVMEGSAAAAVETQKKLIEVSKLPGIGLEEAQTGYLRLRSLKIAGDEAIYMMSNLSNAIALSGGSAEQFNRVSVQMTQILGKSKVMQQDLNVIAESMPMIRTLMQDTFGETTAEGIRKLHISNREFIDGLIEAMGTLPKAKDNLQNTIDNVGVSWSRFKASLIDKQFMMEFLSSWSNLLDQMTEHFEGATVNWSTILSKFMTSGVMGVAGYISGGGVQNEAAQSRADQLQSLLDRKAELQAMGTGGSVEDLRARAEEIRKIDSEFEGIRLAAKMSADIADTRAQFAKLNKAAPPPSQTDDKEAKKIAEFNDKLWQQRQDASLQSQYDEFKRQDQERKDRLKLYREGSAKNENYDVLGYGEGDNVYSIQMSDKYLEEYKKQHNALMKGYAEDAKTREDLDEEVAEKRKKLDEEALRRQISLANSASSIVGGIYGTIYDDLKNKNMDFWESVYDAFSEVMTRMAIEYAARSSVWLAFSMFSGGSSSVLGGFASYVFGGGRASGGAVFPGDSYRYNERLGGEVFTPVTAGMVSPNHQGSFGGDVYNIHLSGTATRRDAVNFTKWQRQAARGRLSPVTGGAL